MEHNEKCALYLMELCVSVLRDSIPKEKPEDISWQEIFKLSKFHSVANITYAAMGKLKNKPDSELMKQWKILYDRATIKDVKQRQELEALSKIFASEQIRYMPLKGCVLKQLYPRSDYRLMADMDILMDEENAERIRDILVNRGYKVESFHKGVHDTYLKEPIYNIEMHRDLMSPTLEKAHEYFHQGFLLAHESKIPYRYELSMEDFYVYNIAHFYKHYNGSGSGVRSLLDLCVLNNTYGGKLDLEHIEGLLRGLDLYDFYEEMKRLTDALYKNEVLNDELMVLFMFIYSSGTYGTSYNRVKNQLEQKGKLRYYLERLFLPYSHMVMGYPILEKVPVLLPVYWSIRIIKVLISPERIRRAEKEVRMVQRAEGHKKIEH